MPRRQTREVPRWRRGKPPQRPAPQVIQINGRHARAFVRDLAAREAGREGSREGNPAAPVNDALARTGAWRNRRRLPPLAWGAGIAVLGAALRATPNPVLFGVLGGLAASALMIGFTRHLPVFARRWSDTAALLTAGWVAAISAAGFRTPVPALLALTWTVHSAFWWAHYRARPPEHAEEEQPAPEDTTSDRAIWARLAARRKWSAQLTNPEAIPGGGVKWQVETDGIETHIGNIMTEPRAIAAAYGKPQTEAYVEPHPSGIESRGVFTRLKAGTLQQTREWDGHGFSQAGIARVGRYADSQPVRIRAWIPRDGTRHGLIAGTSGAGKSELLNLLLWLAVTSEVPVVPVILDPQNGQSLPQWQDKVLYAAGVGECARMMRGLYAGMMDRSRRLASMTWDDDGHRAKGLQFFDATLTGLPVVMPIMDEAPLLLSGDGNAKLGTEMVYLTAGGAKLGRKTGLSNWLVAQVPSLAELGGDQALRSMLAGGNVIGLRTGDRVSAGMLGMEADPSALPKYFPGGEPTQGIGYAVTMDNRQAPMRTDMVPSLMRHRPVTVPRFEDEFLEAMDYAMGAQGLLLPSVPSLPSPALRPETPADDGPEGRRCADAVLQVLTDRGAEMERGEIIQWTADLVKGAWGRDQPFSIRSVTNALRALADAGKIAKVREGVYRTAVTAQASGNDR
jgi:hypothetical protein